MSYVLVSLLGDAATAANDDFARWFEESHPPSASFHAEHPSHDEVAAALRSTPCALVFGHDGGGSLRGSGTGAPWVDPQTFARIFAGARVWVYACSTRSKELDEDLVSFGRLARQGGVTVFAGHASPITAIPPFSSMPAMRGPVYQGLARGFRAFLQGENSAEALRHKVLAGAAIGRGVALAALQIERDIQALRVLA